MPRGRGRGNRGNFRQNANRNDGRISVHDRLNTSGNGQRPNKATNATKLTTKFIRRTAQNDLSSRRSITLSCALLPDSSKVRTLVKKIVREYYVIFDTQGRLGIEHAYHDQAFYSMTDTSIQAINAPNVTDFSSRNLLETTDPHGRLAKLRCGKDHIAQAFKAFPHTKHFVDAFTKDVPFYTMNTLTVSSLQIVVTGHFRDLSQPGIVLKSFTRIFVLKQVGLDEQGEPRFVIFNDLFMIQAPNEEQVKRSGETMIQSIMQKTRMTHFHSNQLLNEHYWREDVALATFHQLKQENKIPDTCFQAGSKS